MSAARSTVRGTTLRVLAPGTPPGAARYLEAAYHAMAWYALPRWRLAQFGVEPEISCDSRTDRTGPIVHLKRDVDVAAFVRAFEAAGFAHMVRREHRFAGLCPMRARLRILQVAGQAIVIANDQHERPREPIKVLQRATVGFEKTVR